MIDSWNQCLEDLAKTPTFEDARMWLCTVEPRQNGDTLTLCVPNRYTKEWIEQHCLRWIAEWFARRQHDIPGDIPKSVCVMVGSSRPSASDAAGSPSMPAARPVETYINPNYTFDRLVSGSANERAIVAAKAFAGGAMDFAPPFFIYGGVGLGKTHLMHAIGNELLRQNPQVRIAYRHAEKFVSEMVTAIREERIDAFKSFYRSLDVLLIDDVQMFINKTQTQEQFFHTFNALVEREKRMVLSSDRYPHDIDGIQERLRSRFSGGLCEMIAPPELETRVAILEKKSEEININLPRDAAFLIANIVQSNVRELEGVLNRVKASALFSGKAITTDFVKNTLSDIISMRRGHVSLDNIQRLVAKYYNLSISDLCSARRSARIVRPRQIAMALVKELTRHSYPEIGAAFGGRDHTTVIHACRKIAGLRASEPDFDAEYRQIKASLHCL